MELTAEPLRLFQAPDGPPEPGAMAQVRSDSSGAYRFDELAEGEYRIRTIATDLYSPAEVVVRTGVDSADLLVRDERVITVEGQVKNGRGKALEGVRISCTETPTPQAFTDPDGNYRLRIQGSPSNHNYIVKFQRTGYRTELRQLNESRIDGGGTVRIDTGMTPVTATVDVAGRVTDREGVALAGETVSLLGLGRYQSITEQDGRFLLAGVETDQTYTLRVPARRPFRPFVKQVQIGPDAPWQEVVLERGPPESAGLRGRMTDTTGNPLPLFTLWLQSFNPAARGLVQVTSDDAGRYAVEEVPLGALSFMTASQPKLLVRGINLGEGGGENVDLILDWADYEVHGQVVNLQERPLGGARVTLLWSHQDRGVLSQSERETVSDANGLFRFAHVGPGTHSVRVSVPGFGDARVQRNVGADFGALIVRLDVSSQAAVGGN